MTDAAYLIDPQTVEALDLMGPTIAFLTPPSADDDGPCVMRGTIPPGAVVPLHSHADQETFLPIMGEFEGLAYPARWVRIRPGDVFHIPGGAKHAFRNLSGEPAVMIMLTTSRIGRFFREVGRPVGSGAPTADVLEHFAETADRYGYWNATAEENAEIGLALPPAAV